VAALWNDDNLLGRSGSVVIAAEVAREFGFADIDGKSPAPVTM
jgi:hypothetical protein